jgi:hypothetical protein
MATRDLIRDIVEKGQAGMSDPASAAEANEAVARATIEACYALGELLDDLIRRVTRLEGEGAATAHLDSQLRGIRHELISLEKTVDKSAKKEKRKRKRKAKEM